MKFISVTFHALAILLLIAVAGLFLASMLPIPGSIQVKIVKSGSMEPAIHTGSVVIIRPVANYAIGDVITFGADTRTQIPTTHRIVEIQQRDGTTWISTKGDANEEKDTKETSLHDVIGKVLISIPYAGFVLDFAKQPIGFFLLIALPAIIIILDELLAIAREIKKRRPKKPDNGGGSGGGPSESGGNKMIYSRRFMTDDIFLPVGIRTIRARAAVIAPRQFTNVAASALALVLVFGFHHNAIGGTVSYFRDDEFSAENLFGAGEWDFSTTTAPIQSFALLLNDEATSTDSVDETDITTPEPEPEFEPEVLGESVESAATSTPENAPESDVPEEKNAGDTSPEVVPPPEPPPAPEPTPEPPPPPPESPPSE